MLTQVSPAAHGVQALVQRAVLLFRAQVLSAQRCAFALQVKLQEPAVQAAVALATGVVQVAQVTPQASAVVLGTHVGATAVPRLQKPGVSQTQLHIRAVLPWGALQVASPSVAGCGIGHATQDVPQVAGDVSSTQENAGPVAGQRWNPA